MCGRYTHMYTWEELHTLMSELTNSMKLETSYNVAPTQLAPIVRSSNGKEWTISQAKWGLIPKWAKEEKIGSSLINARSETITSKPSFKSAFRSRRCLVPISGFYEWKKLDPKTKQPYYIQLESKKPMILAGIWEEWKKSDNETIESFSILTTQADETVSFLHDRMPVILNDEAQRKWLDPGASEQDLLKIISKGLAEPLQIYPVSRIVNSPKNNDIKCVEELNEAQ